MTGGVKETGHPAALKILAAPQVWGYPAAFGTSFSGSGEWCKHTLCRAEVICPGVGKERHRGQ